MDDDDKTPPTDDDGYEVGYGKPPKHTRFKPGQSGNPKGRPKGSKNFATDLREELGETVTVRENGKVKIISKRRAMLKAQVAKAAAGDPRAAKIVKEWSDQHLPEANIEHGSAPLGVDDEAILDLFKEHQREALKEDKDDGVT